MAIHVQPVVEQIRFYEEGSYEERSPYCLTATILYESMETVVIQGLHGKCSRHLMIELFQYLYEKGVRSVRAERNGKWISRKVTNLSHRM